MHLLKINLLLVTIVVECCYVQCAGSMDDGQMKTGHGVSNFEHIVKSLLRRGDVRTTESLSPRMKRSSLLVPYTSSLQSGSDEPEEQPDSDVRKETSATRKYQIASVDFDHVSSPFIITSWILTAGLAKIGFQVTPKLRMICPESCMLLLIGVVIGLILYFTGVTAVGSLTPNVFFLYMLPPIVLDAGYFMPNRLFFDNLLTILMFAVVGTVWNAITIGLSLWAIGLTGLYDRKLPLLDTLLFSSIISAVDPVAVLAVFEEIHVNEILYIIVFGESLLNDAVTVVLYHMFEGYAVMGVSDIYAKDYATGVASFFVVALGGTSLGIIWGVIAAFISRFTHHVLAIEPLFVFVMAYLSYLTAELFHLSGIMALTFCGITMKNYVEENVSHKSHITVKYTMKMLACSSETIIFVLLGVATVNNKHEWNTWFVLFTILFCLTHRALGVVILTAIVNRFRLHQLNFVEQFIMSYGGLRGAVAFALVLVIDEDVIPSKNMMVTAVISVVYFTVFVQGMTIGFFVNTLKVPKSKKSQISMNERLHITMIDHVMAGIESISDHLLGNFKLRDKFRYYNNKYIRPLLTNNSMIQEPKLLQTYSKLSMNDALNLAKSNANLSRVQAVDFSSSFSSIFKSYSQATMNRLAPDETHLTLPGGSLFNVDLGEISYSPSFKDLADAEIHHILEDSMFKPARKVRRYSRSEFSEPPPKRSSSFHRQHHQQIRRAVSESKKPKLRVPHVKAQNNLGLRCCSSKKRGKRQVPSTVLYEKKEDEGITFSVRKTSDTDEQALTARTVAETTLPWKRNFGNRGKVCPVEESPLRSRARERFGYLSATAELSRAYSLSEPRLNSSQRMPNIETVLELQESGNEASRCCQERENSSRQLKVELGDPGPSSKSPQIYSNNRDRVSEAARVSQDVISLSSTETLSIEGPDDTLCEENEGFGSYKQK